MCNASLAPLVHTHVHVINFVVLTWPKPYKLHLLRISVFVWTQHTQWRNNPFICSFCSFYCSSSSAGGPRRPSRRRGSQLVMPGTKEQKVWPLASNVQTYNLLKHNDPLLETCLHWSYIWWWVCGNMIIWKELVSFWVPGCQTKLYIYFLYCMLQYCCIGTYNYVLSHFWVLALENFTGTPSFFVSKYNNYFKTT